MRACGTPRDWAGGMGQSSSCCRALSAERSGDSFTPSSFVAGQDVESEEEEELVEEKEQPLERQRSRPRRRELTYHKASFVRTTSAFVLKRQ